MALVGAILLLLSCLQIVVNAFPGGFGFPEDNVVSHLFHSQFPTKLLAVVKAVKHPTNVLTMDGVDNLFDGCC